MTISTLISRFLFRVPAAPRFATSQGRQNRPAWQPVSYALSHGQGFYRSFFNCIRSFNLWFALPVAIWLCSGWLGLLMQWPSIANPVEIHAQDSTSNVARDLQ